MDEDIEHTIQRIEAIAKLMDSQVKIPGTGQSIGLDAVIGLIPGVGDTIGLAVSGYIVSEAARLEIPNEKLAHMGFNIFIDWLIGLIPILGDLFDLGWKANLKNAHIMRQHLNNTTNILDASPDDYDVIE